MDRGGYPMQAFAALKAAKPPATPRGRERQEILEEEARRTGARRVHILKHEWARTRLCSILGLQRPDQWNGFMPPKTQPADDKTGMSAPNNSAQRKLLLSLSWDVDHFEKTGKLPAYAAEGKPAPVEADPA